MDEADLLPKPATERREFALSDWLASTTYEQRQELLHKARNCTKPRKPRTTERRIR